MVDIEHLSVALAHLDDRLVKWSDADNALFQSRSNAGAVIDDIMRAIVQDRQSRVESGVADPKGELFDLLDAVVAAYMDGDDVQRGIIRGAFNGKDRVLASLGSYMSRMTEQVRTSKDAAALRAGLAAASILDQRGDTHDLMISLGDLYRAASHAGIAPESQFQAVAAMSSTTYPSKLGTMRAVLDTFHHSEYFRLSVAPEL